MAWAWIVKSMRRPHTYMNQIESYNVGWEKHRRTKHNILRHYETIDFNVFFTKNAKDTICFYKFSTYINKFLMFPYLPTYKQ